MYVNRNNIVQQILVRREIKFLVLEMWFIVLYFVQVFLMRLQMRFIFVEVEGIFQRLTFMSVKFVFYLFLYCNSVFLNCCYR